MTLTKKSKMWTISKDALLDVVDLLELVPTRPGIPASEFIKIDATKTGISLQVASEISGFFEVEGDGDWPIKHSWYIDRRLFFPFVLVAKSLKSKADFEFSLRLTENEKDKEQLILRHGNRKASFAKSPEVPGYSSLPTGSGNALTISPASLNLIVCAKECASGDPTTPELNCVFIEPSRARSELRIFASNTKLLYYAKSGEKVKMPGPVPMPLFLVSLLNDERMKRLALTPKEVVVEFGIGRIWQSTSTKAKNFPVKKLLEYMQAGKEYDEVFSVEGKVFAASVARLGVCLTAVRRQDWVLIVKGTKGESKLTLSSSVPQSEFRELIKGVQVARDVELHWPLDMLLPVYDYLSKGKEGNLTVRLDKDGRAFVQTKHINLIVPRKKK